MPGTLNRMLGRMREHWQRGQRYTSRGTWTLETYHRVMSNLRRHGSWPGRGRIIEVRLRGEERPLFVRLGTSDFTVMDEIWTGREYERFIGMLKGNVREVVDLGANIGMSVRQWQRHFPAARIVAVEPDAGSVQVLCRNASAEPIGSLPPVNVVQACVAGSNREVQLDRSRGAWAYSMSDAVTDSTATVPAVTMTEILKSTHVDGVIDILKCDIEGAEGEVFANCSDWIGRVRNIVIEVHPPYSVDDLSRDIERAGVGEKFRTELGDCKGGNQVIMLFSRNEN